MLTAQYRLKKNADILKVYRRGAYGAGGGLLSLKVAPNRMTLSRSVIVVSKKIDKRAVVRNRIRRRLAALMAELWGTVPSGYDIVVTVHADVSTVAADTLRKSLETALARSLRAATHQ